MRCWNIFFVVKFLFNLLNVLFIFLSFDEEINVVSDGLWDVVFDLILII